MEGCGFQFAAPDLLNVWSIRQLLTIREILPLTDRSVPSPSRTPEAELCFRDLGSRFGILTVLRVTTVRFRSTSGALRARLNSTIEAEELIDQLESVNSLYGMARHRIENSQCTRNAWNSLILLLDKESKAAHHGGVNLERPWGGRGQRRRKAKDQPIREAKSWPSLHFPTKVL